jgi:hypothetical protein
LLGLSVLTAIHAAEMFGVDDASRFEFVECLVDIIGASDAIIFRVGYVRSAKVQSTFKTETSLQACFDGLPRVLSNELKKSDLASNGNGLHLVTRRSTFLPASFEALIILR